MKRGFCLLLAAVLALSLAACGENSAPTVPEGTAATGEQLNSQPATDNQTEPAFKTVYLKTREIVSSEESAESSWTYDDSGNMLSYTYSCDGRGFSYAYTYDASGNRIGEGFTDEQGKISRSAFAYDEKGNMIRYDRFDPDGSLACTYTYAYDNGGNLTEMVYAAAGKPDKETTTHSYNPDGRLLSTKRVNDANQVYLSVFTYDLNGNRLSSADYLNDVLTNAEQWEYDSASNMLSHVTQEVYTDKLEFAGSEVYTYDENGNMLTETIYFSEDTLAERYVYTYDKMGNQLTKEYYSSASTEASMRLTCDYDENGNLLSEVAYTADSTVDYRTEYAYDQAGNKLSSTRYDADGSISSRTEYTYIAIEVPNK